MKKQKTKQDQLPRLKALLRSMTCASGRKRKKTIKRRMKTIKKIMKIKKTKKIKKKTRKIKKMTRIKTSE